MSIILSKCESEYLQKYIRRRSLISPAGCWEWVGWKTEHGYGRMMLLGVKIMVTHVSLWAFRKLKVPSGKFALHSCDNPGCVNPEHLWIGTRFDNQRDAAKKGRLHSQKKTHCPQGHLYDAINTGHYRSSRRCRTCGREKMRARRANGYRG